MAPRETVKTTPKRQRTVSKTKIKASPIATVKKALATRKLVDATPMKESRAPSKTRTAAPSTPKHKENQPAPVPSSVTKSGKKVRKLKKAHSGVPIPSKMLKMMGKQLQAAGTV